MRDTIGSDMSTVVHLLGRPSITLPSGSTYQFRSRKSWAILAYLILSEQPPTRSQLAALLFDQADDPTRALRWSLTEVRRGLGDGGSIDGDPVVLVLPPGAIVDVDVVARGSWRDAVRLPGLGAELLEGMTMRGATGFETWLLSKQRHVAAASEAILHEAALSCMSRGELDLALAYAARATSMSPFDENHQVLLIRLYRMNGDDARARQQYETCRDTYLRELGAEPSLAVEQAMRETMPGPGNTASETTIDALVEAGAAAVAAGAVMAGVQSLRTAARFADDAGASRLSVSSRQVLGETLIHSLGGLDEEGVAMLHEANEIAIDHGLDDAIAEARAELGYVDYLRARYDRAEVWLTEALAFVNGAPGVTAKATTYLGCVESDRANYEHASRLLGDAVELSRLAGTTRMGAFALSMLGRVHLLRGELELAAARLEESVDVAEHDHWLAFLPWPQALLGEVQVGRGGASEAAELLEQAFARACQLGNPCWEGMTARAIALAAHAQGDTDRAFDVLNDALSRSDRLADPYVWLGGYILDVQCRLGVAYAHPDTAMWVSTMQRLTARTGMRELEVRSLLHGAALGSDGDLIAARLLSADVENPALAHLLASTPAAMTAHGAVVQLPS